MKTTTYFKLVRDKIPEIIEADGKCAHYRQSRDDAEFEEALKEKLIEETFELLEAASDVDNVLTPKGQDDVIEEMADIMEVLGYMYGRNDIFEKVRRRAINKYGKKGGFDQRYLLECVVEEDEDDGSET